MFLCQFSPQLHAYTVDFEGFLEQELLLNG